MNNLQLTLKYAMRRAVHFNPYSVRWASGAPTRERMSDDKRAARTDFLLNRTLVAASNRIAAYAHLRGRIPDRDLVPFLIDQVPIIGKSDLQRERERYYPNCGVSKAWWGVGKTSGTSGSPLEIFRSLSSMAMEQAVLLQHWRWAGFRVNDRQVVVRGDLVVPPDRSEPPFWFHDRVGRSLIVSTRHLNEKNTDAVAEAIQNFRAPWLRCYPSAGYELARLLSERGAGMQFKGIITGSEPVFPIQRDLMEQTFRAPLYAGYGMAERVVYAAQCEHGRFHVNLDYGHTEIVDEKGQPTRESGYLVGTSFHNQVMPLLRYRLDDTARWDPRPCPCGRHYPVLADLEGRVEDQLLDLKGNPVNSAVITFVFKEATCIQRTQVAQVARDRWEVRIVPDRGYTDEVGVKLRNDFRRLVSPHVNVEVRRVDHLANLASGKFKWVVQEWRAEGARES